MEKEEKQDDSDHFHAAKANYLHVITFFFFFFAFSRYVRFKSVFCTQNAMGLTMIKVDGTLKSYRPSGIIRASYYSTT